MILENPRIIQIYLPSQEEQDPSSLPRHRSSGGWSPGSWSPGGWSPGS